MRHQNEVIHNFKSYIMCLTLLRYSISISLFSGVCTFDRAIFPLYSAKMSTAISTQIFKWRMLTWWFVSLSFHSSKILLRHSSHGTASVRSPFSFLEQIKFPMIQIPIEAVRTILGGGPFPGCSFISRSLDPFSSFFLK